MGCIHGAVLRCEVWFFVVNRTHNLSTSFSLNCHDIANEKNNFLDHLAEYCATSPDPFKLSNGLFDDFTGGVEVGKYGFIYYFF